MEILSFRAFTDHIILPLISFWK